MAVTTRWTPFTTTPIIGSTTYPEDIDTRNTEMASRMEEIDDMGQEMNGVADEVEANGNTVASNLVQSNSDKADAEAAAAEAVAAAEAIESYVIPEDATYTYSDIDTKDELQNAGTMTASGYVGGRIVKADMFTEGSTPNEITVTPKSVRFEGDKIYPITDTEGSTDELLDDAEDGITTQSDHSVGDIIVTGNQRVINGGFDSGAGWTPQTAWVISSGVATVTSSASTQIVYRDMPELIADDDYVVSFEITAVSAQGFTAYLGGSVSQIFNTVGTHTAVVTMGSANTLCGIGASATGTTGSVDNFSIRAKDTIYQNIADSTAGDDLTLTEKFQVLTRVTRQDLILITKTGYTTVKGIHTFPNGTSHDTIASAYSMSKIGNGLYSYNGDEVNIAGLSAPRLSGGGYEPFYNSKGCRQFSDNEDWNDTTDTIVSVYDCFDNRSSSTTSGRPDSKIETLIYYKGEGGIVFKPTYSQQANEHENNISCNWMVYSRNRHIKYSQYW